MFQYSSSMEIMRCSRHVVVFVNTPRPEALSLRGPNMFFGWLYITDESDSNNERYFHSRENLSKLYTSHIIFLSSLCISSFD